MGAPFSGVLPHTGSWMEPGFARPMVPQPPKAPWLLAPLPSWLVSPSPPWGGPQLRGEQEGTQRCLHRRQDPGHRAAAVLAAGAWWLQVHH